MRFVATYSAPAHKEIIYNSGVTEKAVERAIELMANGGRMMEEKENKKKKKENERVKEKKNAEKTRLTKSQKRAQCRWRKRERIRKWKTEDDLVFRCVFATL